MDLLGSIGEEFILKETVLLQEDINILIGRACRNAFFVTCAQDKALEIVTEHKGSRIQL